MGCVCGAGGKDSNENIKKIRNPSKFEKFLLLDDQSDIYFQIYICIHRNVIKERKWNKKTKII